MNRFHKYAPGLLSAFLIAAAANGLGRLFPLVGGAVFGILLGIVLANLFLVPAGMTDGLNFASKKILQWAIIVLGSGLSLGEVYQTGASSLIIILSTISTALLAAFLIGKILKVSFNLTSLIGVGTAICGGSAIAAVAPVIEAEDQEIAYAISTVFLFNVIAVLIFPPLGHFLAMSQLGFGLFAGTAINDTSSVVAAGYAFGNSAGDYAAIVKLTRTIMIIPIAAAFVPIMMIRRRRKAAQSGSKSFDYRTAFPWFIAGFLLASALNTSGIVPQPVLGFLKELGKFMIVMALSAIGLKTDLKKMFCTGLKPALLGLAVWVTVALTSLVMQNIYSQW